MSLDTEMVVVVIMDASRDVSLTAIEKALKDLTLKAGDRVFLLGVVHQVNNPSRLSFKPGKLLGYKSKVDSGSILGTNEKFIEEAVEQKKEEYKNNEGLKRIWQRYELEKVDFVIDVQSGYSPKSVALTAARNHKATWIVLDRHMKKGKKYLMDRLPCGILIMKRNNQVENLRTPQKVASNKVAARKRISTRRSRLHVTYDEMVEGSTDDESSTRKSISLHKNEKAEDTGSIGDSPHRSNSRSTFTKSSSTDYLITTAVSASSTSGNMRASSSSFSEAKSSPLHLKYQENSMNIEKETAGEQFPEQGCRKSFKQVSPESLPVIQSEKYNDLISGPAKLFINPICTSCKNRRPMIGCIRDFTFAELQAATEGFSRDNYLSEGGFGSVFKGELNGLKIAVKQHKNASFQGEKEFKSEVNVLSDARHENLVMLIGSCSEGSHRLLVYEYVCNGSLDRHLSKLSHRPLSWEERMKIAVGAARGLQYLHEKNIIHRDMRPNNILVTHDFEPLLGDFGLAKTQYEDSDNSSETRVVGTLGYLAPEYAECGKVSSKTDVYAFGVVLLQLITGLETADKALEGRSLVGWARPLLKERNYPELIDKRIIDSHDFHQLFGMVWVAEKCLTKDPQKRLTMGTVVKALTDMMKGKSVCCIGAFSPANSDSFSSITESLDSPSDVSKDDKNLTSASITTTLCSE